METCRKKSCVLLVLVAVAISLMFFSLSFSGYETISKRGYKHVPDKIIQFGMGRTATTLQFQILCVLMSLLHESDIQRVSCIFKRKPLHKYCVMKYHNFKEFPQPLSSDMWVFMTTSSSLTKKEVRVLQNTKRLVQEKGVRIPLIVDVREVRNRSENIIFAYQDLFGISDIKMRHAVEYIHYWDILRLCCGRQMSKKWRTHLLSKKTYTNDKKNHSSTYHTCQNYDISDVEKQLMKTYVYQHFFHISSLNEIIGRPSNIDGELNGTYCERCNRNIVVKRLKFNDDCS